ncbi:MAG: carboxypeptidase-like regulatory domain-containing protein [Methanobacteriota archaeon]
MKKFLIITIALALIFIQATLATTPISGRSEYCCAYDSADSETYGGFAPVHYGSISGSVYGQNDWMTYPLVGAKVEAGGKTDYTDIFGNFIIHDLPVDHTYLVVASKLGYENQDHQVTITLSAPLAFTHFILERSGTGGGKIYRIEQIACEGYGDEPICGGEY